VFQLLEFRLLELALEISGSSGEDDFVGVKFKVNGAPRRQKTKLDVRRRVAVVEAVWCGVSKLRKLAD
jgi:hypothetical protein